MGLLNDAGERVYKGFDKFYQTNLGNGEFWKHKGSYLLAAVLGYVVFSATCGAKHESHPRETGSLEYRLK